MKKQIARATAIIGLLLTLGAAQLVHAQTARHMVVEVPFAFVAGDSRLPAGSYTVRRVTADSAKALLIKSADGRHVATVLTNSSGEAASGATLTFTQYDENFFLAGVSLPGTADARQLPRSKREKQLRRELRERAAKGQAAVEEAASKSVTVEGSLR